MNKYAQDISLLSSQFQPVARWWDSVVFVDKKDPAVILKLYDPLEYNDVLRYYDIQKEISQKAWVISDWYIELQVMDPKSSDKFAISENEDGVLVVLPRVPGENLATFWSDIQRTRIMNRVKELMIQKWLPTSGGFEVKPENLMVSDRRWGEKLMVTITDVWARADECLAEYKKQL